MRINQLFKIFISSLRSGVLRFLLILLLALLGVIYSDDDLIRLDGFQGVVRAGFGGSTELIAGQRIRPFPKDEKYLVAVKAKGQSVSINGMMPVEKFQVPVFLGGKPAMVWSGWSTGAYSITQDFGHNGHYGQDFGLTGNPNPGYEVRPVAEGKVVFAGWTGEDGWGFAVLIKHLLRDGTYCYSQYGHLYDFPAVRAGDAVTKETLLGYVGDTGRSFGPHLDLQIKEIPSLKGKSVEKGTAYDLGFGYTEGSENFGGAVIQDPRTGCTYYKPSYFVINYNASGK